MGTQTSSTESPQEWEITVKAYKTVTYKIKKGDTNILKQTGTPSSGSTSGPISYSVNVGNGEMSLIKSDTEQIPAGHDGDIAVLIGVLKSMVSEIESHIEPSDKN